MLLRALRIILNTYLVHSPAPAGVSISALLVVSVLLFRLRIDVCACEQQQFAHDMNEPSNLKPSVCFLQTVRFWPPECAGDLISLKEFAIFTTLSSLSVTAAASPACLRDLTLSVCEAFAGKIIDRTHSRVYYLSITAGDLSQVCEPEGNSNAFKADLLCSETEGKAAPLIA